VVIGCKGRDQALNILDGNPCIQPELIVGEIGCFYISQLNKVQSIFLYQLVFIITFTCATSQEEDVGYINLY